MTLRNRCVACDSVLEAPDTMRGRQMACPECDAPNVLLGAEDAALRHEQTLRNEQRRSGDLRERLNGGGAASTLTLQAGQRLRDISVYLLGFAYLILLLSVVVGGVLAAGLETSVTWRAVAFLSSALAGVFLYIYLKFMSDAVRALAELGRAIERRMSQVVDLVEDRSSSRSENGSETG